MTTNKTADVNATEETTTTTTKKGLFSKVKGASKYIAYAAGAAVVGGGCYMAYSMLKGAGAVGMAEAVGDVAGAAAEAAADAVAHAFRK